MSRRKAKQPITSDTLGPARRGRALAVGMLLVAATLVVCAQSLRAELFR